MLGGTKCDRVFRFWNVLGSRFLFLSVVVVGCLTVTINTGGAEPSFPCYDTDNRSSIKNSNLIMYVLTPKKEI